MGTALQGCFPEEGSENHLYILQMEDYSSKKKFPFSNQPPEGPHHGMGILTCKPLPCEKVCVFVFLINNANFTRGFFVFTAVLNNANFTYYILFFFTYFL